jgi:DNA-binding PadR family transcriptional regulator
VTATGRLGRFLEPAMWILIALEGGPLTTVELFDRVRGIDGPVGPATLFAAIARLERRALISATVRGQGVRTYAATDDGAAVGAGSALLLDR